MRALLSAILAAAAIPGLASDAGAEQPDGSVDPVLEARVEEFVAAFVDGANSPTEQLAFFADRVHYYDQGVVGRPHISRDIGYTMRRWPLRENRLVEIEYLKPLPDEDKVFVSFLIDYDVSDGRRAVRGSARYGAVIGSIEQQPRIEGIFEKVTRRQRTPAGP